MPVMAVNNETSTSGPATTGPSPARSAGGRAWMLWLGQQPRHRCCTVPQRHSASFCRGPGPNSDWWPHATTGSPSPARTAVRTLDPCGGVAVRRLLLSTGSLARHNLAANPQIALHLESGDQVVIVEGVAAPVTGAGRLQAFLAAYNPKYDWDLAATDDQVTDSAGGAGPAYRVRPLVVFAWDADMRAPTRWSFADSTTPLTP
jgi:hypothetical protein